MKPLGHVPALNGVRGLAIAAVCGVHFLGLQGGFFGVDVFFVLSGFLITTLLLEERDRDGAIRLGAFYRRRARRLLPALGFLVAIVGAWIAATSGVVRASELVALALYVENFARAFSHVGVSPFGPLWSLAQEEQFYLLWPAALILLLRHMTPGRLTACLASIFVALVLYRAGLVVAGASWERVYYSPDTHADGLVLGCLIAFLRREGLRVGWMAGTAGLCALVWLFASARFATSGSEVIALPLAEIAAACLVLAVLQPGPLQRAFSAAPVVWVGVLSYSLYLWQGVGLDRYGLPAVAAMGLLSYYLVERRFRQPVDRRRPGLAPAWQFGRRRPGLSPETRAQEPEASA